MKVSREVAAELAMLRCTLNEGSEPNNPTKPEYTEFADAKGNPVFVDLCGGIVYLKAEKGDKTKIVYNGGASIVVQGDPSQIKAILEA